LILFTLLSKGYEWKRVNPIVLWPTVMIDEYGAMVEWQLAEDCSVWRKSCPCGTPMYLGLPRWETGDWLPKLWNGPCHYV